MVSEYKTGQNYTIYNLQVIIPIFFMEREVSIKSSCCQPDKLLKFRKLIHYTIFPETA
jgi:hypothetical protein